MKLHDAPAEVLFLESIDKQFPYGDRAGSSALISEARSLSLNAVFCVLHEICRPPMGGEVTRQRQRELVGEWSVAFDHELKAPLLRCAEALIGGHSLPWPEAVAVIEKIGRFQAQRAALSVAYFSGDCDTSEGDAALNSAERRVRDAWETMDV